METSEVVDLLRPILTIDGTISNWNKSEVERKYREKIQRFHPDQYREHHAMKVKKN